MSVDKHIGRMQVLIQYWYCLTMKVGQTTGHIKSLRGGGESKDKELLFSRTAYNRQLLRVFQGEIHILQEVIKSTIMHGLAHKVDNWFVSTDTET